MAGKLFLSGGGDENQTYLFDEIFLQDVDSILYIPVAWKNENFEGCLKWFTETMQKHKNVKIEMLIDLNKSINLNNYDAVYIGGGNTFKLLKKIKESHFDKKLVDFFAKGGTVYGGSAGAIIMGRDINIASICEDADENNVNLKNTSGIGFFITDIQCHFKDSQIEEHKKFIKKSEADVLCIPEESGLILEDEEIKVAGEKPVTLITAKEIKKYKVGEVVR